MMSYVNNSNYISITYNILSRIINKNCMRIKQKDNVISIPIISWKKYSNKKKELTTF